MAMERMPAPPILWPGPPANCFESLSPPEDLPQVHVWAGPLDLPSETREALASTLSGAELQRAARFHFEIHRNRFIAGRGLLRRILARYLATEPSGLCITYGKNGKPSLADAPGLHFNLAHAEDLALLAVTRLGPVGVDLEHVRRLEDASQLVARFFSPGESAAYSRLEPQLQPAAFFNLWTRKEALLKATGEGIGELLNRVEVSLVPGEPARLVSAPPQFGSERTWHLFELLSPAAGFAAALAAPASRSTVMPGTYGEVISLSSSGGEGRGEEADYGVWRAPVLHCWRWQIL